MTVACLFLSHEPPTQSSSKTSCHHDLRHPWPLARRHGSICGRAASRAKSATGVLGLVVTRWRLASTDAGSNEGTWLARGWSVVDCKQILSLDSWNTSAWQRQRCSHLWHAGIMDPRALPQDLGTFRVEDGTLGLLVRTFDHTLETPV